MTKNQKSRKPRIVKLEDDIKAQRQTDSKPTGSRSARKPRAQNDLSLLINDTSADFEDNAIDINQYDISTPRRIFSWFGILLAALAGLGSLGLGLAIDQLVRDLFERQTWLGWVATGLTFLLVVAAFGLALREIWGISRLNTIHDLRIRARKVQEGEEPANAERVINSIISLYSGRPDIAASRSRFEENRVDILDGQDALALFETTFMGPLDEKAKSLVMQSAKRVSIVTAISPRALVDIAFVLMENVRLIRRISTLYGGRPGAIGFWKLTRNVLAHLAVTGAIAAGDSLIQQFVGHGIAARISSKFGEGVVNGLLTARIGIAAIDQARPMPFNAQKRPGISQYFSELTHVFSKSGKVK